MNTQDRQTDILQQGTDETGTRPHALGQKQKQSNRALDRRKLMVIFQECVC